LGHWALLLASAPFSPSVRLARLAAMPEGDERDWWGWRLRWWFERKWLGFRWWMLMGGNTDRHPQHYTVWGLILTALLAFGGTLLAITTDLALRGIGIGALALAAYIVLSFFMPLPLPPLWDERVVKARRATAKQVIIDRLHKQAPAERDPVAAQNAARASELILEGEKLRHDFAIAWRTAVRGVFPMLGQDQLAPVREWNAQVLKLADESLSIDESTAVAKFPPLMAQMAGDRIKAMLDNNLDALRKIARS
jgi:hypothetical protein